MLADDWVGPEAGVERSLIYNQISRGVAQPGSAPALGAGGRRFKSYRPDQSFCVASQSHLLIAFRNALAAGRTYRSAASSLGSINTLGAAGGSQTRAA